MPHIAKMTFLMQFLGGAHCLHACAFLKAAPNTIWKQEIRMIGSERNSESHSCLNASNLILWKEQKKIFIFGGLKNLTNLLPKCQLLSFFFPRITSLISDLNYLNLVGTSPLYFWGLSPLFLVFPCSLMMLLITVLCDNNVRKVCCAVSKPLNENRDP